MPAGAIPNELTTNVNASVYAKESLKNSEKPLVGKSGKKICCSCPKTKKARDFCMIVNGQDNCLELIQAHKLCLRSEGFQID